MKPPASLPFRATIQLEGEIRNDGSYLRAMATLEEVVSQAIQDLQWSLPGHVTGGRGDLTIIRPKRPGPTAEPVIPWQEAVRWSNA